MTTKKSTYLLVGGLIGVAGLLSITLLTKNSQSIKNKPHISNASFQSNVKSFKNDKLGISFNYPSDWETGQSSISIVYWVAIPNYASDGNVVLKVIPWASRPNLESYTMEIYKSEILSSSVYYKDIEFLKFNKQIKIDETKGLFSYYKGLGIQGNKIYYEVLIQWWHNNLLYTIQGQFSEPELSTNQIDQFKELIASIRLR